MKIIATVGLALMLLIPVGGFSQQPPRVAEKPPVGYDIAACTPEAFFVVHFDLVSGDLNLTLITKEPGKIEALDEPVLYKFKSEDKVGKHYQSDAGVELIFKFEEHTAMGIQKRNGEVHAIIFGVQGDGTKLAENAVAFSEVCQGLRDDATSSTTPADPATPQKQSGDGDNYTMPDYFGRKGPVVQI